MRLHARAKIQFGTLQREGHIVYFVKDDGASSYVSNVKNVFGVFRRLHAAQEFEGTGVGLATVQRIMRRHGGRVCTEEQPEHGATFYFTLSPEPRQL
jgi:light-regulated signal transduction histidine kinase (bacteriophytochrome)